MATKNSNLITTRESSPQTFNDPGLDSAAVYTKKDAVELATGDLDANDLVMLAALPAGARIHRILVKNDDLDSDTTPTLAANVGVFETDGTTAKDADAFASADTTFQSANTGEWVDVTTEALDIADQNKRLYEHAGDTDASHDAEYYIGIEWSTGAATAAAGTLTFLIEYTV